MLIRNLFFLFSITLFALASFVLDLFNYNPYKSGLSVFLNFYISFFVLVAGILSFVLFFVKSRFKKEKNFNLFFWPSIRQASLLSLGFTVLLVLQGLKILDWWVGGPLLIAAILLELFFQTVSPAKKKIKKQSQNI